MKIRVSCGGFEVEYRGGKKFAKESLCSLIAEIKEITKAEEEASDLDEIHHGKPSGVMKLPSFLAEMERKSARNSREYRKFLVTAAWLHLRKKNRLRTSDVASALLDNRIDKLSNPSDCLKTNIEYGHCERVEKNGFIVTRNGFKDLGLQMPE